MNDLIKKFLPIQSSNSKDKTVVQIARTSLIRFIPLFKLLLNSSTNYIHIKINIDGSRFGKHEHTLGVAILMNSQIDQHKYGNTFPLFFLRSNEKDRG